MDERTGSPKRCWQPSCNNKGESGLKLHVLPDSKAERCCFIYFVVFLLFLVGGCICSLALHFGWRWKSEASKCQMEDKTLIAITWVIHSFPRPRLWREKCHQGHMEWTWVSSSSKRGSSGKLCLF